METPEHGNANEVLCPRCEYQGSIVRATVRALGETIYACDECNAAWLNEDDMAIYMKDLKAGGSVVPVFVARSISERGGGSRYLELVSYLRSRGPNGGWPELDAIEVHWHKSSE